MATVVQDSIQNVVLEEELGAVKRLVRRFIVSGVSGTDSQILSNALAEASIPTYGATPTGFSNLRLVKRSAQVLPDNRANVEITLEYMDAASAGTSFVFEASASLRQITSVRDRAGQLISVSHTFPSNDPDYPSQTKTQGGELNTNVIAVELTATGLLQRDYPLLEVAQWQGHINSKRWAGFPQYTWLCTSVGYKYWDLSTSPNTQQFTFSFELNTLTWIDTVYYTDERTGKPPANIVSGVGYKLIDWYPARDFNDLFPT